MIFQTLLEITDTIGQLLKWTKSSLAGNFSSASKLRLKFPSESGLGFADLASLNRRLDHVLLLLCKLNTSPGIVM